MNSIKLVCFDLDQTLITHSSWRELGHGLGISYEDDLEMLTEYKEGKITYEEWNMKILSRYLEHSDATREGITKILSQYTYADGAQDLVRYLTSKGYTLALISGSIDILVKMVAKELGIEHSWANNTFVFDERNRLENIICSNEEITAKADYLQHLASSLGMHITECACIADGANDIKMFTQTGKGITLSGSPIEKEAWKIVSSLSEIKEIL